jgi:hypothetical protein
MSKPLSEQQICDPLPVRPKKFGYPSSASLLRGHGVVKETSVETTGITFRSIDRRSLLLDLRLLGRSLGDLLLLVVIVIVIGSFLCR